VSVRSGGAPGAKVVIVGAAGFTNLGDDAILAAMLAELREALPDASFAVASGSPERLAGVPRVEGIPFADDAVADALDGAGLLVVGGGGFLYDHDARLSPGDYRRSPEGNFYPYFRRAELAYERGVPVHFYGVGIGPLVTPGGRALAREVLSRAAAITVRDPISLLELRAAGISGPQVELAADPAVRLPPPSALWEELPEGVVVGFVVRSWAWVESRWTGPGAAAYERYLAWLARGADHVVERWDATPVFLPVQRLYDDDLVVEEGVLARMRHAARARVHHAGGHEELRVVLGGLDLLVSTRLHPLILAAAAGTPVVGVTAKPKVRGFLCALGLPDLVLSPWVASSRALAETLDGVLSAPEPVRRGIADGMTAQRAAAGRNPAVAAELLRAA
jgi:polysaccharide pyruvyl transferase WcaK-like protein